MWSLGTRVDVAIEDMQESIAELQKDYYSTNDALQKLRLNKIIKDEDELLEDFESKVEEALSELIRSSETY